jgi:hypothetical protein
MSSWGPSRWGVSKPGWMAKAKIKIRGKRVKARPVPMVLK